MTKTYAPPKLRQVVTEAIFRRRRIVLGTVVVVLALTALATALMHRKFQAQAKLMVQNVRSNAPLNTSPTEHLVSQGDVSVTEVNSEVDLLQSAAVARRALEGGANGEANLSQPDSARQAAAVSALEHRLTVEPVHQTSLINVSLLANSPVAAEQQLNAVLNAYFEQRAGTGRASGAADFFSKQVDAKGRQLQGDQDELTRFEVAHNISDLDDQKKMQVQRIAALEDQLNAVDAALARNRSQTVAERHQLIVTPSRSVAGERTITNQYSQEHLDSELIDLQNKRAELARRYVPTDRQIVELDEKIANIRRGATAAQAHPATESATEVNPVWQNLTQAVSTSVDEASGLAAQHSELQRQKSEAVARLNELQSATGSFDELRRKTQQSQADYQLYLQKRDESRVAEALDREKMFDVSLVQAPIASYQAVRPKPVLYLTAALVFGLLLGVALALYADTAAEQVYTPAQLDSVTGQRTLATLSDEGERSGTAERNRTELRRILVALTGAARRPVEGTPAVDGGILAAITAARGGEGVTHIAAGLAAEAARQTGARVALLDGRQLASQFPSHEQGGFGLRFDEARNYWVMSDVGSAQPADPWEPAAAEPAAAAPVVAAAGGLARVTAGRLCERLRPLLTQTRREFDYIFIDCPSTANSTLTTELAGCVDSFVAVVGAGLSRKDTVENLAEELEEARVPLLGFVLNRRRYDVPAWVHRLVWSRA